MSRPQQVEFDNSVHTEGSNPLNLVDVANLLTVTILVTPTKIIFDPEQWQNYMPNSAITTSVFTNNYTTNTTGVSPGTGMGYLGGNLYKFLPDSLSPGIGDLGVDLYKLNTGFSRLQRLFLSPLSIRYREIDQLQTEILNAKLGDINARWLLNATPAGTEPWKNPDLVCRDPNGIWRTQTNILLEQGIVPTDAQLRAIFDVGLGMGYQNAINDTFTEQNTLSNQYPQQLNSIIANANAATSVANQSNVNLRYTEPMNLQMNNPVNIKPIQESIYFQDPQAAFSENSHGHNVSLTENYNINEAYNATNKKNNTTANINEVKYMSEEAVANPNDVITMQNVSNTIQYQSLDGTANKPLGNDISANVISAPPRPNVGAVGANGIPFMAENPINMINSKASITQYYNGVGNVEMLADGIKFEPLVSAVNPKFEYPSFSVVSKVDVNTRNFVITYVMCRDEKFVFTKTVTLRIETIYPLINNVQKAMNEGLISVKAKLQLITAAGMITTSEVPTDAEFLAAFVVWMYSYIGFTGGCRWNNGNDNTPWIPTVNYDMSLYDVTLESDAKYAVDYMFKRSFLQFMDICLEVTYGVILPSYRRWCSLACGGGWFVLMFAKDRPIEDAIYRHMHVLFTYVTSELYNLKYANGELQKTVLGMNERLSALEYKTYPSMMTYQSNF
uniref:Uncharacterized protein n=1 Tax=viral metagenome TaxID=1070528 RepID=A0A6C0AEQ2_9ZZZZ